MASRLRFSPGGHRYILDAAQMHLAADRFGLLRMLKHHTEPEFRQVSA